MLVLGIESATPQVGVAIGGHEGLLASFHSTRDRRHAETLAPAVEFVCAQARVELSEIGCIAVDIGPGLFTGLRVGLAAAKAFAYALRVPMVGVSSLDLVAFPARLSERLIVSTVDARRGEVFYALYRRVHGGVTRVSEPAVDHPEDVVDQLKALGEDCLVLGDGGARYAEAFAGARGIELAREGFRYPSAASLVELAHMQALREEFVSPREIEPLYLRTPDARINFQARDPQ
jgi:tRNA threonylcarbamoyladenosine biosynthesis protein TsaB